MNYVFLICIIIAYIILLFDQMANNKQKVNDAWEKTNLQLKLRFDLLDNLIVLFKNKDINLENHKNHIDNLIRVKNNYLYSQVPEDAMKANKQLSFALKNLFLAIKNYPDLDYLESNVLFINFKENLLRSEDRILRAAQVYNSAVVKYNDSLLVFPNKFYANAFGFRKIKYFNKDESERSLPKPEQ